MSAIPDMQWCLPLRRQHMAGVFVVSATASGATKLQASTPRRKLDRTRRILFGKASTSQARVTTTPGRSGRSYVLCLSPAISKRPNGSTWPAAFCSAIRIGPRLPSSWPRIAPSPSVRPTATSSRHSDSSTAMSKCRLPSSFRVVSSSDSATPRLRRFGRIDLERGRQP